MASERLLVIWAWRREQGVCSKRSTLCCASLVAFEKSFSNFPKDLDSCYLAGRTWHSSMVPTSSLLFLDVHQKVEFYQEYLMHLSASFVNDFDVDYATGPYQEKKTEASIFFLPSIVQSSLSQAHLD